MPTTAGPAARLLPATTTKVTGDAGQQGAVVVDNDRCRSVSVDAASRVRGG